VVEGYVRKQIERNVFLKKPRQNFFKKIAYKGDVTKNKNKIPKCSDKERETGIPICLNC
jgi:hypothetical protein